MRRWLVAVFALHFFLSAGAFAFGQLPGALPSQAHAQGLVAEAVSSAQPAPEGALAHDQGADHGLTDLQADLPECLDAPITASSRGEARRTPSPPLAQDLTPPVLDGPQRPPRGLLAFA